MRNLNDVDVGGRPLRIDFADMDPLMEGRTTQHGQFDQDDVRRRAAAAGRAGRPGTFGHAAGGGAPPGRWGNQARDGGYAQRGPDAGFGGGPGGFGQPPTGPGQGMGMGMGMGGMGPGPAPGAVLPPNLPQGVPLPPGVGATDAITQTLATLPPNQLLDIMSQMKVSTLRKARVGIDEKSFGTNASHFVCSP